MKPGVGLWGVIALFIASATVGIPSARLSDPVVEDRVELRNRFRTAVEGAGWEKRLTFLFSDELQDKAALGKGLMRLDQAFDEFAAAADINLIAQHYRKRRREGGFYGDGKPAPFPTGFSRDSVKEGISRLSEWAGYAAEYSGDAVVLKNSTGPRDDDFQIDLDRDRPVRSYGDVNGLDFQAHLASDAFTEKQRVFLAVEFPFLGSVHPALDVRDALDGYATAAYRIYGLLAPAQRRTVRETGMLPLSQLSSEPMALARAFIPEEGLPESEIRESFILQWLPQENSENSFVYSLFYLVNGSGERHRVDNERPLPYGSVFPALARKNPATRLPTDAQMEVRDGKVTLRAHAVTLGEVLHASPPSSRNA